MLIALVALEHLWFLVMESFLWKTPFGRRTFRTTPEQAEATASLAANQGLYNGFLAAGLVWSLLAAPDRALSLATFFLGCVIVAGIVGSFTAIRSILYVQALPALLALVAARWL